MLNRHLEVSINEVFYFARHHDYELITIEQLLLALLNNLEVIELLGACQANITQLRAGLTSFVEDTTPHRQQSKSLLDPQPTLGFQRVIQRAIFHGQSSGQRDVNGVDVLLAMFAEKESEATYQLHQQGIDRLKVLDFVVKQHKQPYQDTIFLPEDEIQQDKTEQKQSSENDSVLTQYATNLNEKARAGAIDPIIARDKELARVIQILCRRRKNNPLLVGESGVGKTAIAEGLAKKIVDAQVPDAIQDIVVYSLDLGSLLAGTKYRGDFEKRLKNLLLALQKIPQAILFIDEIHNIIGAGAVSGSALDASNLLKPILSSGELKFMGSTTYYEYRSIFERDRALARRFQKVDVKESTVRETVDILLGIQHLMENHHHVQYTFTALKQAAKLSKRYLTDRFLPDKAIDVLDEAGAYQSLLPDDQRKSIIDAEEVEAIVARMVGIPAKSVSATDQAILQHLERNLKMMVYGQNEAIHVLSAAIHTARSGLGDPDKPIGSFLFAGPTGVGKTEVARQLANIMGIKLLRYDMSEYMEQHSVARLIGSPPGYIGYERGGLLTEDVNKHPYAVLLLDEIEKAHPDIYNLLLQVMDHGSLTDNDGRVADFRHIIIILTTNAGAEILQKTQIGFQQQDNSSDSLQEVKRVFTPEFRNRLDTIIQFSSLSQEVVGHIVDKFIVELEARLEEQHVSLSISKRAKAWLAHHGYDDSMGARPMARLIKEKIKRPLAKELLFGKLHQGGHVEIDVASQDDELSFLCQRKSVLVKSKAKAQVNSH